MRGPWEASLRSTGSSTTWKTSRIPAARAGAVHQAADCALAQHAEGGLWKHWSTDSDGALTHGTWGRFLTRKRFQDISLFLHFNDNSSSSAAEDKAWKIRPLIQALQKTFKRVYRLGKAVSFDEGMVPSTSQYNPMRVFMKDKPKKWGSKLYLTCCAETAYCAKCEVVLFCRIRGSVT